MSTRRSFESEKGVLILDEGLNVDGTLAIQWNRAGAGLASYDFYTGVGDARRLMGEIIVSAFLLCRDCPDDQRTNKAKRIRDFFHKHVLTFIPFGEEDE